MRTHLIAGALAACLASEAMAIEFSHILTDEKAGDAKPMAWRYRVLAAGQDRFDQDAPMLAPGASLAFVLPKVEGGGNRVQIVKAEGAVSLPMVSPTSFKLVRDDSAAEENAEVVVNRSFASGQVIHPNVQVRSPGLAPDTRRLGDLRLACRVQVAMVKTEELKIRTLLAVGGMFGLDVCKSAKVDEIDAPRRFARVVLEYGTRRAVYGSRAAGLQGVPALSDSAWPDDTRVSYVSEGVAVQ